MIAGSQHRDQLRHVSISLQPAETLDGFQDTGADPAQNHPATPPPFHIAPDVSGATDETLRRIRRRQGPTQAIRDAECQHGQRFVEATRTLSAALG